MITVYLRKEPTTDPLVLQYKGQLKRPVLDVQAYRDPECQIRFGRWDWWMRTKPKQGCKWVTLNCATWKAVWLPEVKP